MVLSQLNYQHQGWYPPLPHHCTDSAQDELNPCRDAATAVLRAGHDLCGVYVQPVLESGQLLLLRRLVRARRGDHPVHHLRHAHPRQDRAHAQTQLCGGCRSASGIWWAYFLCGKSAMLMAHKTSLRL